MYPQKEFDEDPEDRLVNEKFRVRAGAVPGPCSSRMSWGFPSKRPLLASPSCCALPMGSGQQQGSCQSSEQDEKGSWGRCPVHNPSPSPPLPGALSRGSMAPSPAPGPGSRGACPSLPRAAAIPGMEFYLGWNFTCRLPAAGNSVLQESARHSRVDWTNSMKKNVF